MRERVALRASEIGLVRKELVELSDSLTNGLLFPGAELLTPLLFGPPLDTVFSYLPAGTVVWIIEPGRVLAEAIRVTEQTAAAAEAAQSKPSFYPAPESLYLGADEFEDALGAMTAVEAGSLVTMAAPREGWAPAIEVKCQPSLKLGARSLTGPRTPPSFEPLATELREVQRGQGRALMIVEGANQAARLRRHLEAYDLSVNTECKSFGRSLESADFRPAIMEGESPSGMVLQADGLYVYSEEDLFGEPRVRRRSRRSPRARCSISRNCSPTTCRRAYRITASGDYRGLRHMKVAGTEGDFLALNTPATTRCTCRSSASTWSSAISAATARSPSSISSARRLVGPGQAAHQARRCSRWPPSCSTSMPRAR